MFSGDFRPIIASRSRRPRRTWAGGLLIALTTVFLMSVAVPGRALAQGCGMPISGLPPAMQELIGAGDGAACQQPLSPQPGRASGPVTPPRPATPRAINGDHLDDEVLVTLAGDAGVAQDIANTLGLNVISTRTSFLLASTVARLGIPDGRTPAAVLAQIGADSRAEDFEAHHLYDLQQSISTPPRFELAKLALNPAGDGLTGRGVKVAIIDTALDADHPAFAGMNIAEFDAYPGEQVVNRKHATSVAGLVAGQTAGGGIAPGASLMIARAFDAAADGTSRSSADAILASLDWAAEQGARVINMSFAGPRNRIVTRAIEQAAARGIVLIAAAGNNGPGAPFAYPAAERSVLAVTATDARDRAYTNANRGSYIFIAAPGVDVAAPVPGGAFEYVSGTSFAAALLTGIAALMIEANPALPPAAIAARLSNVATDLGQPGRDATFGVGLATARGLFQ